MIGENVNWPLCRLAESEVGRLGDALVNDGPRDRLPDR